MLILNFLKLTLADIFAKAYTQSSDAGVSRKSCLRSVYLISLSIPHLKYLDSLYTLPGIGELLSKGGN